MNMDIDDDRAIEAAAQRRRDHLAGIDCGCDECLDARRAALQRVIREDERERWRWWRSLVMRVLRAVTR